MQITSFTQSPVTGNVARLSSFDFQRVMRRVVRDHAVSEEQATVMLQGALDFLTMCSTYRGQQFTPSKAVDDAWHTFLLYSKPYAGFCAALGVRLWHEPNDGEVPHVGGYTKTLHFMQENGIVYDRTLWAELSVAGDSVADPSTCCSEVSNEFQLN